MDIRLKTINKRLLDRDCELCCNMNVLADVQEAYGGNLMDALGSPATLKVTLVFLAAMFNDCADTNGWPERVTPKELGRKIPPNELFALTEEIPALITSAVQAITTEEKEDSKN